MGLPNFCYHLAIKEMAINGKIRLVSLVVYNYILPRKAGKCNNHPCCGVSRNLTEHMAHLIQTAVWTTGLDDRLTDSGLISFQLCKAYAPPVGVKGQISTVCLYTAGPTLASTHPFILSYLGRFDGGTVFRSIMLSPRKVFLGRIQDEGEIRFQQLRPRFLQCLFQYNRGQ